MAELDPVQAGFDSEFEALQAARERIEQAGLSPQEREAALQGLAEREMAHVRRVQRYREEREFEAFNQSMAAPSQAPAPEPTAPPPTPAAEVVSYNATPLEPRTPEEDARDLRVRQVELERAQRALEAAESGAMSVGAAVGGVGAVRESGATQLRTRVAELEQEIAARQEDLARRVSGQVTPIKPEPVGTGFVTSTPTYVTPVPVGPPGAPTPPAGAAAGTTGTPTPGQPSTAPGARPRGTGGGRPRPQTASIAEQLLAALQNGSPDQDEILQRLVDSYQREATTRDDFGEQGSIVVDAGLQEQQELARARQEEFEQELIAQERRLQEIDTALGVLSSTRFDANRLFTDRGLATSMALGVAVNAATSLAQNALFPGANAGNTALQIVNGAIERDIQTQVVNYERGVQSVQGMRTAYEMARNLSQDRQAAYEFAAAISQRRVGEQLRGMAMQTQGLVAREQLMRQADSLLLQAAQREQNARTQMAQLMFANQPRGTGGAGRGPQATIWAPFARVSQAAQQAGLRTPSDVLKALGQAGGDRLRDFLSSSADVVELLDQIRDLASNYSSLSLVDRSRMTNLVTNFMTAFKEQAQLGALDSGVERVLNQIISNPNSVTTTMAEFQGQIRNQRAITMSRIRRRVQTLGGGLLEYDPTAGFTAPQNQEPGVTIVGETPSREDTVGSVATAEGGVREIRAIQGAIGEGMTRAIFGNATIDALAGGE